MSGFDYSKWDNIELSDDESDCHPNIDKESWFRMKHRSRVERETREADEKEKLEKANKEDKDRIAEIMEQLVELEDEEDAEVLNEEVKDLEEAIAKRDQRIDDMEKNKKWNVDNMCHVVEERTMIGKSKDKTTKSDLPPDLAEAQAEKEKSRAAAAAAEAEAAEPAVGPRSERAEVLSYASFVETHEDLLEKYIAIKGLDETRDLLHAKGEILLEEHASSYLLLSCLEDEMNGFHEKMWHSACQSQIFFYILELAQSLRRPPQDVVIPFFRRISEAEYLAGFLDAVNTFIVKIEKRAVEKRKEMDEEAKRKKAMGVSEDGEEDLVELSAEERMGPGGLDPVEVFESLPEAMQEAFQSQDTEKLKAALVGMPAEEASYHMKRCEDSGLWVSGQ